MTEIKIPVHFRPRPYQLIALKAIDKGIKRFIFVWHRRSGKDYTAFAAIVVRRALERVGTYFYILPTYNQASKVIWNGIDKDGFRFIDHIPDEIIKDKNATDMRITLKNGSIIQLIGAENIDRIVGTNPVGVIFSEFSLMRPKVWDFIRPILAENGGWAGFIFTPRGMNHAHTLLQQAKNSPTEWYVSVLSVKDTQAIPADVLEQEKKEMPRDLYEQEYMVKFIEGATAVFKNVDVSTYEQPFICSPEHRYRLGVDLAKVNDFTVITAFDLMTFRVGKQERFNQIDYNLQQAKIEAVYYRYGKPLTHIDSTGVGEPIFDSLTHRGLTHLEAFHFTEASRRDLLTNLQILLETGKIRIPRDEELLNELKSFQYSVTGTGKIRMEAPDGLHDDMVMSLALAVWNIPSDPMRPINETREKKELLRQFDFHKNKQTSKRHGIMRA
jgi:hypothetical protein